MNRPQDILALDWREECVAFLALSLVQGVGYWTMRRLFDRGIPLASLMRTDDDQEFVDAFRHLDVRVGRGLADLSLERRRSLWHEGVSLLQNLRSQGISLLLAGQPDFPRLLFDCPEPPNWIFVQGSLSSLDGPGIALVGTRKPTADGLFLAQYLGATLPRLQAVAVSGLAEGIDNVIHRSAVRFGVPTIAVLGHGFLARTQLGDPLLKEAIVKGGGALVTEYLPSQSYSSENFVRRNRLQVGLSRIVVPVEWKLKSGTAHTVRFAIDQGRDIICIRMSDWAMHDEIQHAVQAGAQVFTIPGEENELLTAIRQKLARKLQDPRPQLQLGLDGVAQPAEQVARWPRA